MEKFMWTSQIEKRNVESSQYYLLRVNALNKNPEYPKWFYDALVNEFNFEVQNQSYFQNMWTSSKRDREMYPSDLEMNNIISTQVSPEGIRLEREEYI
jgi:hypothetical protein